MALRRPAPPSKLKLQVPLSTSNLGPGFDAFSVTLNHSLKIQWAPAEKTSLDRKGALADSALSTGRDPLLRGLRRAAILAGKKLPPGKIQVDCTLPPGRGLGASGAGIIGGLLLGQKLAGGEPPHSILHGEAITLEGHPENCTGSLLGGAHWSSCDANGDWIHLPIPLHRDLRFLLVIPPYPLSTKRAREVLATSVSFQRATQQARRTPVLLEGLKTLDERLIRSGIRDELHVEARLRLLTGAKAMLEFADRAGAIAGTLSGAGSSLLLLTRTGQLSQLETRIKRRVKRLWGESGMVVQARLNTKGASFR
ncbi:MAG: hypothetical protein MK213_10065 [Planctomycetes bacterium]|nr:hypothetical protein [Planctomycetota bacterium]